jgi:putative phosphonate metabolism protein
MARYAVYFAPEPSSPLWRFGSGVIGYDAATGHELPYLTTAGLPAESWRALTAEPRRDGFHAALKAPFELVDGADADDLLAAAEKLALSLETISLARLRMADIGRFIALVPSEASVPLHVLADQSVTRLDHLRAPLGEADRARRLASALTARQIALLDQYGYPYVLEEFRFHMTLTGPIPDAAQRDAVRDALSALYAEAVPPERLVLDRIAVFRQPARDHRFEILAAFPLSRPQTA